MYVGQNFCPSLGLGYLCFLQCARRFCVCSPVLCVFAGSVCVRPLRVSIAGLFGVAGLFAVYVVGFCSSFGFCSSRPGAFCSLVGVVSPVREEAVSVSVGVGLSFLLSLYVSSAYWASRSVASGLACEDPVAVAR